MEIFQPTRPLRGATLLLLSLRRTFPFQPTRPLRGATFYGRRRFLVYDISTHAPLAGRDNRVLNPSNSSNISTHAPLAGRDTVRPNLFNSLMRFQPTRPLRGATNELILQVFKISNFNPRAPCGARLVRSTNFDKRI